MCPRQPTGAPWLFCNIARQRSANTLGGKCAADRSQRVKNADATRGTCPTARTKRSTKGIMTVISLQSPFEKREAPPASRMLMKRRSRTRSGRWWPWMSPSHQLAILQSPAESTLAMHASRSGIADVGIILGSWTRRQPAAPQTVRLAKMRVRLRARTQDRETATSLPAHRSREPHQPGNETARVATQTARSTGVVCDRLDLHPAMAGPASVVSSLQDGHTAPRTPVGVVDRQEFFELACGEELSAGSPNVKIHWGRARPNRWKDEAC